MYAQKIRFVPLMTSFFAILIFITLRPFPVYADTISEIEPNDTLAQAQLLSSIGRDSPLSAAINTPGDVDWYKFQATAGRTYVVELFNVASSLGAWGYECGGYYGDGVGIRVYDQAGNLVVSSCDAYGAGNVHNYLSFTAGVTGVYYILVQPNSKTAAGAYSLRVLPKYDEPGASWDPATHEPNNSIWNAYAIGLGRENALTSTIEQRDPTYSTYTVDRDWYRFNAVAGRTYVVELFNVASSLGAWGYECGGYYGDGVGIRVYDQAGNLVVSSCDAYGAGNVHNYLSFTAGVTGVYYILVQPNSKTAAGAYSLRVLPKYDEPGASWDPATHEPNNSIWNAYAIGLGRENALTSIIEQRDPTYSTYTVDHDWYRFNAVAGRTYVVELFNVASSLGAWGYECDGYYGDGVGIRVYDQAGNLVVSSCDANTSSYIHNSLSFVAGLNGVYYILVQPNSKTAYGTYTICLSHSSCIRRVYLPLIRR